MTNSASKKFTHTCTHIHVVDLIITINPPHRQRKGINDDKWLREREEKMKQFTVYVKQHYEPVTVMAVDRDDAEYQVQNHKGWGEPIDVEITAEEDA